MKSCHVMKQLETQKRECRLQRLLVQHLIHGIGGSIHHMTVLKWASLKVEVNDAGFQQRHPSLAKKCIIKCNKCSIKRPNLVVLLGGWLDEGHHGTK